MLYQLHGKFLIMLIAILLCDCAPSVNATPTHWEWYPTLTLKAELNLDKGLLTFKLTNIGGTDQTVSDLLFNEDFLKQNIQIQIRSVDRKNGNDDDIFNLSSNGLVRDNNRIFQIVKKTIKPSDFLEVQFNIIEAIKQIHNDKLASDLSQSHALYKIIFPISFYDLSDNPEAGSIQFVTTPVPYLSP